MSVDKFLQYLQYEKNYSSHTVLSYRNDISQFVSFLESEIGDADIAGAESEHIRKWMVSLMSKKLTARSVNRKISALKSFYKFLIREKEITHNPTKNLITPKIKKPLPSFFKEKEVLEALELILDKADSVESYRDALIINLFFQTGVRVSELVSIKDKDVDVYTRSLRVVGKRNKERKIPVGVKLQEQIADYIKKRNAETGSVDGYLFVRRDGKKLYERLVYDVVKKTMSQVSTLAKISPHVLRHTFASVVLNNGADLNAVKELLGHENLHATQVYTHTSFEQLRDIYKKAHPRAENK